MQLEPRAESLSPAEVAALLASHRSLEAQVAELKHQLDWFKKQLFGSKSERRLVEPSPDQLSLGEALKGAPQGEISAQPVASYTRRRPTRPDEDDAASGLRFDDSVPVEVIELEDPETEGLTADALEVIGEKVTYRLAQQRGGYVTEFLTRPFLLRAQVGTAVAPFPAPATSHAACGFPALRVPAHFTPRYMRPIGLALLSAGADSVVVEQPEFVI